MSAALHRRTNRGVGRFEQAEGGTLFLDEIGDMRWRPDAPAARIAAGRIHHRRRPHPIKTDVRIIAATNRDLRS